MNRVRAHRPIRVVSRGYFESVGGRIARARKAHGYTQRELATRIGVSQQALFSYETGERRPSLLVAERIATVLSMSIDQITGLASMPKLRKGRLSPRAMRHAERLQGLSRTHQRFVIKIIDQLEDRQIAKK